MSESWRDAGGYRLYMQSGDGQGECEPKHSLGVSDINHLKTFSLYADNNFLFYVMFLLYQVEYTVWIRSINPPVHSSLEWKTTPPAETFL